MRPATERLLGIEGNFLSRLSETVIEGSKDGYPELEEKKEFIFKVLTRKKKNSTRPLIRVLNILTRYGRRNESKRRESTLSGENAFKLYDTYGFPLDLTKEILEEKGYSIDEDGFKAAMEEQRSQGQNCHEKYPTTWEQMQPFTMRSIHPSHHEFVGYDKL